MNYLKTLPKVELHLHLDGSVRPQTASQILNEDRTQMEKEMIAPLDCTDLNEYLTKFEIPEKVLQTKENLERVAKELAEDLKEENVIYAEIRFAPMKHLKKDLTKEEVVESVLKGLSEVDIKTNVILCMMRGASYEENKEVLTLAKKYLKKGVCAIDLAGAEALYKTEEYRPLFTQAQKDGIPFTIHAGEADGKESIHSALSFKTKRIGHGVRITEEERLIEKVKKENILLEICPTSNIQTAIFKTYQEHPIKKFYEQFIPVSINTDNRTVSNTTLTQEYQHIIKNLNMTVEEIIHMNKNAILHAFLEEKEKESLLAKYTEMVEQWQKKSKEE